MDQLERLKTLINVADEILERQQGGENVDAEAVALAILIGREIQQIED